MKGYNVYDCHLNGDTVNFGGLEWVVDGECGRRTFPGSIPKCLAVRLYTNGLTLTENTIGFCNGCTGSMLDGMICKKEIEGNEV